MNRLHRWLCGSQPWKSTVATRLLPWVLEGVELGPLVLEIGPGPGATTEWLRRRAAHLACVEIDPTLAERLADRFEGRNVTVLCEDATAMSLPDGAFDAAVSVIMLHHVPTPALQDRLLAEVRRVLRPGGIFAGADSTSSPLFRLMHAADTMVVVDPRVLPARLTAAGFVDVRVETRPHVFKFQARRPA